MTTHVDLGQAERARWFSGEVELYASEIRRKSRWVVVKTLWQRTKAELGRHLILFRPSMQRRDEVLLDAAVALRAGAPEAALKILNPYYRALLGDPAYLNMLAVATELEGDVNTAMKLYIVCKQLDEGYAPATANLERCIAGDARTQVTPAVKLGDVAIRTHRARA